ncbi:hypothetical protein DACRYDRAFT_23288 [Dacryopinax primogenitus]|uniref:Uncharacterized protein n=1 Tax=Dacryopinax primogenitus (strain DJM 731) TaxID=1858805 RepID=M5FXA2_DACPD|nr:uncharacterized protein DACRYDRAFT_23288 [Dacryopinax primogenitus]EJU00395.1 hypothetical protein DACRYDRAFT_23288 [Dacryopinax primogenitus]
MGWYALREPELGAAPSSLSSSASTSTTANSTDSTTSAASAPSALPPDHEKEQEHLSPPPPRSLNSYFAYIPHLPRAPSPLRVGRPWLERWEMEAEQREGRVTREVGRRLRVPERVRGEGHETQNGKERGREREPHPLSVLTGWESPELEPELGQERQEGQESLMSPISPTSGSASPSPPTPPDALQTTITPPVTPPRKTRAALPESDKRHAELEAMEAEMRQAGGEGKPPPYSPHSPHTPNRPNSGSLPSSPSTPHTPHTPHTPSRPTASELLALLTLTLSLLDTSQDLWELSGKAERMTREDLEMREIVLLSEGMGRGVGRGWGGMGV